MEVFTARVEKLNNTTARCTTIAECSKLASFKIGIPLDPNIELKWNYYTCNDHISRVLDKAISIYR